MRLCLAYPGNPRRYIEGESPHLWRDIQSSTYGSKQVAKWLKKIREPFLFGLDAEETGEFLAKRELRVVSDLGPEELEKAYLQTKNGLYLGKTLGHVRIAHARATGSL
jgi:O-methyltransferase involved in polyketide biosynthesis